MKKIFDKCPICNGEIFIKEVECLECSSSIKGKFQFSHSKSYTNKESNDLLNLQSLDSELVHFLKTFIEAEGSIKQTEKKLNCSYPKVKNYLKKLKSAMGIGESEKKSKTDEILSLLENDEIDINEALEKLK
ncbi:MAG: hypothetical protein CR982_01030 [Candidatus Cloacimonadota bacterium]|nr:MAG: hypothetical protein CR982_01030 [Candidatus Cloacimonadota bacterium]PIE77757.1 MAG: hypothetical protein CSA15_11220 [Candidatus Delongbacteria bacterium]